MRHTISSRLLLLSFTVGFAPISLAQSAPKAAESRGGMSAKMTPELKKDMADMYQKMADCMRTDKTLEQCSADAMQNCPVVQQTGHCPINEGTSGMGGKRMKHGMGMGKGMGMGQMPERRSMEGQ